MPRERTGRFWWVRWMLGVGVVVALALAPMAWNGISLQRHRDRVVGEMTEVLNEYGEVTDVASGPWKHAPTGSLCETLVRVTAASVVAGPGLERRLEQRVSANVELLRVGNDAGHVVATAYLVQPGESALFGCS